jgi:DNA polymerase IV (DinB-like DNA polymerase)
MADVFEQVSVDEAFLDVSKKTGGDYGKAKQTAEDIKQHILAQQQLTCSVGIGPNKLVAKIASGLEKPDGLTVVQAGNAESFLTPLPIKKLYGIGPKAGEKLAEAGVETVGDIRGLRREELIKLFGVKKGGFIYDACRGVDERPVAPRVREQYSSLASFRRDTRDWGEVKEMVEGLSSKVAGKVEASGRGFKTITVAFITEDFTTHTKSRTLEYYAGDAGAVVKTAEELAKKFLDENNVLIRRLGVGVSNLSKPSSQKNITEYLND